MFESIISNCFSVIYIRAMHLSNFALVREILLELILCSTAIFLLLLTEKFREF